MRGKDTPSWPMSSWADPPRGSRCARLPRLACLRRHGLVYLCRVSCMRSRSAFSAQTLSVLAALFAEPAQWQHGYALAKLTGLKSGTLYPILIRLADRGLVEACWEQ